MGRRKNKHPNQVRKRNRALTPPKQPQYEPVQLNPMLEDPAHSEIIVFFAGELSNSKKSMKVIDISNQKVYTIPANILRDENNQPMDLATLKKESLLRLFVEKDQPTHIQFISEDEMPDVYEENKGKFEVIKDKPKQEEVKQMVEDSNWRDQEPVVWNGVVKKIEQKVEVLCAAKDFDRVFMVEKVYFTRMPKIGDKVRLVIKEGEILEVTMMSDAKPEPTAKKISQNEIPQADLQKSKQDQAIRMDPAKIMPPEQLNLSYTSLDSAILMQPHFVLTNSAQKSKQDQAIRMDPAKIMPPEQLNLSYKSLDSAILMQPYFVPTNSAQSGLPFQPNPSSNSEKTFGQQIPQTTGSNLHSLPYTSNYTDPLNPQYQTTQLKHSLPQNSIPQNSMPQHLLTQPPLLKNSIPQPSMPQPSMPQPSMPPNSMPQQPLLKHSMPQHLPTQPPLLKHSMPTYSMPPNSMPPNSMPQSSMSQSSMPPNSMPPNSMPQPPLLRNSMPQHLLTQPPLLKHSIPQPSIPQPSIPQPSIPQHSIPQHSIPQHSLTVTALPKLNQENPIQPSITSHPQNPAVLPHSILPPKHIIPGPSPSNPQFNTSVIPEIPINHSGIIAIQSFNSSSLISGFPSKPSSMQNLMPYNPQKPKILEPSPAPAIAFLSPLDAVDDQKLPIDTLKSLNSSNPEFISMIDTLATSYESLRLVKKDGNSFYRVLGVLYLEHLCSKSTEIQEFEYFLSRLNFLLEDSFLSASPEFLFFIDSLKSLMTIKINFPSAVVPLKGCFKDPKFDTGMILTIRNLSYKHLEVAMTDLKFRNMFRETNFMSSIKTLGVEADNEEYLAMANSFGVSIDLVVIGQGMNVMKYAPSEGSYVSTHISLVKINGYHDILYREEKR